MQNEAIKVLKIKQYKGVHWTQIPNRVIVNRLTYITEYIVNFVVAKIPEQVVENVFFEIKDVSFYMTACIRHI